MHFFSFQAGRTLVPCRKRAVSLFNIPRRSLIWYKKFLITFLAFGLLSLSAAAELKPATSAAYQKYISDLEARLNLQNQSATDFLWLNGDPARLQTVRDGKIASEHKSVSDVPGGMIQHWIGGIFMPGATISRIVAIDQDYADYAKFYSPEISQPKVLSHDGNHFVVSYRITKKKVLTAVEDTVHAIDYRPVSPNRMTVRSRSTSVNEVEDAGTPSERVLPAGEGAGFLWAMNSYWRMEEKDGGVYVECEAVTLSRDVPFGLGGMINPILQSFAEESLKKTLDSKRVAVSSGR
jgi:hypothetical protein